MNQIAKQPDEGAELAPFRDYDGTTYYGRAQLKPAPFQNAVVGGYIFVAGLSGGAAILAALSDATGRPEFEAVARRGRYLMLLAPVVGSPLLIYDLHTPKRFYNMLRVAKHTSPMSIGTWILMSFSGFAGAAAVAQLGADIWPRQNWLRLLARVATLPAAVAGAGLSTYTASLMSATSTPVWAAAPQALAVRYGSSSMAAAAAALGFSEADEGVRSKLQGVQAVALLTEAAATVACESAYKIKGVDEAFHSGYGVTERVGATALGVLLPLGLLAASSLLDRRSRTASTWGSVAVLAGSALLRVSMLGVGDRSAARPDVSFRFSTPDNLPDRTRP